jgi:hypothetical protein
MEGYSAKGIFSNVVLELRLYLWILFDVKIDGKCGGFFSGEKMEAASRKLMYFKSVTMEEERLDRK